MTVLLNNNILVPFLSRPMTFVKGIDPLGLQNTSEATFGKLLPGLNNVTGRVRYYSFYCWILEEYSIRIGSTDPREQRKFLRRAELLIALINRSTEEEVGGIPGSLFANRLLREDEYSYDLKAGTYNPDGTTEGTYWKYPAGAFGQYYLGSLTDIGIISERDHSSPVYVRTPSIDGIKVSGSELAAAFDQNINPNNKKAFFKAIDDGVVKNKTLQSLFSDFNMSAVPDGNRERKMLLTLLLQKDYPQQLDEANVSFRRDTLKHVLAYANNHNDLSDRSFTIYAYKLHGRVSSGVDACLLGWYYYQLNEFWQYSCLAILNSTLSILEKTAGNGFRSINRLVSEVTDLIVSQLKSRKLIQNSEEKIEIIVNRSKNWPTEVELFHAIRDHKADRIVNSVLLIFKIYANNVRNLQELKEFATSWHVEKDGDPVTYFLRFDQAKKMTIADFLRQFLLKNIIYRHQFVAFRKMGNGSYSTQLFILEDGMIRKLKNNFEPTSTAPRIARLIRFLYDLGILNEQARLTNEGKHLLKQMQNEKP